MKQKMSGLGAVPGRLLTRESWRLRGHPRPTGRFGMPAGLGPRVWSYPALHRRMPAVRAGRCPPPRLCGREGPMSPPLFEPTITQQTAIVDHLVNAVVRDATGESDGDIC